MKKIFLILMIIGALLTAGKLILMAPGHFYNSALREGVATNYLELRRLPKQYYSSSPLEHQKMRDAVIEDENKWKNFHFQNFIFPFPIHHPVYLVVPYLDYQNSKTLLGYKLTNHLKKEIASVRILNTQQYKLNFKDNKIFELPFFKSFILDKGHQFLWKQLFTLDLEEDQKKKKTWEQELLKDYESTLQNLALKLFILVNRSQLMPTSTKSIHYDEKSNIGVVEIQESDASNHTEERIFLLRGNTLFTISLRIKRENLLAEAFRRRFFKMLKFQESHQDSAVSIYAEYKKLGHKSKEDQEGMTYLFNAWSHNVNEKRYFSQMIFYLERGKQSKYQINSLYNFSFKRWGTNFSNDKNKRKETQEEKLKRKIQEELEEEIQENKKKDIELTHGDFTDNESKVNYYLKKAKEDTNLEDVSKQKLIED